MAPRKLGEPKSSDTMVLVCRVQERLKAGGWGGGTEHRRLGHPEMWFLCSNYLPDFERVISPLRLQSPSLQNEAVGLDYLKVLTSPDSPKASLLLTAHFHFAKALGVTTSCPFPSLACLVSEKQTLSFLSSKSKHPLEASFY